MKKHFRMALLIVLLFILNPINLIKLIKPINETVQTDEINQTNQINIVFAQESKKQPGTGSIRVPKGYVIGQGDVLEIFVWRNEELSRQTTVRPDGKISLPLIQDLQAEGLTVPRLKDRITQELKQYVQNPTVTVIVSRIQSYKISILGKVANPGVYPITTETTLLEAISMAGGFTEWAKTRKITVIRNEGGKKEKFRINYKKIVSGKDPSQNIILRRGDTIVVP
jgi:polysaccharide export outer membrane protein